MLQRTIVLCLTMLLAALVSAGDALSDELEFAVGDRVAALQGDAWLPGVVIEVDEQTDFYKVQLDEDPSIPEFIKGDNRKLMLERTVAAKSVRKPDERAADKPTTTQPSRATPRDRPAPTLEGGRVWKDATGRFSIEAVYRGLHDGKVELERADGKRMRVPLEKLSSADKDFVARQGDGEDPFAFAGNGRDDAPTQPANEQANTRPSGELPRAAGRPRRGGTRTLRPRNFSRWTFEPPLVDTAVTLPTIERQFASLSQLPDSRTTKGEIDGIRVTSDHKSLWVLRSSGSILRDAQSHVEVVDLDGNVGNLVYDLPANMKLLDVLPNEALISYRSVGRSSGAGATLFVARLDQSGSTPLGQWVPFSASSFGRPSDIERAEFINPKRLLVIADHPKRVVVWDIETGKPALSIPVGFWFDEPFLSEDRRFLAIGMDSGIAIVDLVAEEHVATVRADELDGHLRACAFSSDNRKIAAVESGHLMVWDLTNGNRILDWDEHSMFGAFAQLAWAGDFVLVDGSYLIDVEKGILLWEYTGSHGLFAPHDVMTMHRGLLMAEIRGGIGRSEGLPLLIGSFPCDEALSLASEMADDDLIELERGDSVTLHLDIDPRIAQEEAIRDRLIDRLTRAGLVVTDDAPVVVRGTCKMLPSQEIKINTSGLEQAPPSTVQELLEPRYVDLSKFVTKTITPSHSALAIEKDGQTLFSRSRMARPGMTIFVQPGETLDATLERFTRPRPEMLTETPIALPLRRPGTATRNGAYGSSPLVGTGKFGGGDGLRFE